MKKKLLIDFLISLSLSNLLFVFGRGSISAMPSHYHNYAESYIFLQHPFILSIFLLALLFFSLTQIDRYFNKGAVSIIGKSGFMIFVLAILHEIRVYIFASTSQIIAIQNWIGENFPRLIYLLIFGIFGVILAYFGFRYFQKTITAAKHFILILTPFFCLTFSNYVNETFVFNNSWELQKKYISNQILQPKALTDKSSSNRVVWIIFDEFDYRVAFESHFVNLPELLKFKETAVSTSQALSPAHNTLQSIPSLLTGNIVEKTEYIGIDDLKLFYSDGTSTNFKSYEGLFSNLYQSNKKIGVVGTYHPYCRIFGDKLKYCIDYTYHYEESKSSTDRKYSITDLIKHHVSTSLTYFPFWYRTFDEGKLSEDSFANYYNAYQTATESSKSIAARDDFDMVFLHILIPHSPFIYNSETERFDGSGNYLMNLKLADKMFGEIRKSMEDSGVWDNSTVIISSDHSWRIDNGGAIETTDPAYTATDGGKYDPRVPFIIKLKRQKDAVTFDKPVNTVITSEIIVNIFGNNIKTPEDLMKFLESNSLK